MSQTIRLNHASTGHARLAEGHAHQDATSKAMLNSTPFDISPNTHLDEDWFRERWPSLQHQMRDLHGSPVLLDLSAVEWVDPVPLLAIICECGRGVGLGTISLVTLKLGEWGSGEVSARRARVRKYLLHHKWLDAFRRYLSTEVHVIYQRNDAEGPRTYVLDEQSEYAQLKADLLADVGSVGLLFTHDALIEPVVFTADTWADGVRQSVEAVNDSYFRRSTKRTGLRGTTLQRLRACLKELVMNGIEHAYDGVVDSANSPVKPLVAVYARYREVVADAVLAIAGAPLGGAGDGLQPKAIGDAWVELYVVDVGKGLWADAEKWSEDEALSLRMRNELQQICRSVNPQPALSEFVWNQKVSKLGRAAGSVALQNRGHLTGLSYLNGVLAINGDFSNWCTGNIWRYGRHPIGDGHHGKLIALAVPFQGTCFRIGLDLKPIQAVPVYWYSPATHPLVTKTIINRLANESLIGKIIPFALHDLRASSDSQVSTNIKSLLRLDSLIAGNTLVRVPRHFDKADASTLVNAWLTSIAKTQDASTDFTLVIADLSRAQAMNVEISIADPHSTNDEAVHFQVLADSFPRRVSIILICEDLAAVAYRVLRLRARQSVTREAGVATFQQLNLRRFDFGRFHSSAERAARLRWAKLMQSVLIQLRSMDSALFWDRANLIDTTGALLTPNEN